MSEARNAKSEGERSRKYWEENKLRNELSNVKQQVRRSFVLASGRSEADWMKKAITNKYPSLIISSCHHITNTIWPQTQKSHGGHFHRKKTVNVTVWHGSSMEYNRVFYEVKKLRRWIIFLHLCIFDGLLCKWWDIFIYNNQVWLFALQNPETSLCDH